MMRLLAVLFACLAFVSPVLAGEVDEAFARGVAAYNDGDYPAAFAAFRSAAEGGKGDAQFNLGLMYANGEGVARDHGAALYWWRRAAAQGVADAQNNLGMMYEDGLGMPPDYAEAVRWYREAAEQGRPYAQHNLGAMYANGRGVERDLVQAYMWFHLATAGHPAGPVRNQSAEARDRVALLMNASELSSAQRLAKAWLPAAQRATAARAKAAAAKDGKPAVKPSKNYIKLAQQALRELGYDPGPLDGIEGERTRAALAAFQEASGLEATGELTMALVHRLTRYVRGGDAASVGE